MRNRIPAPRFPATPEQLHTIRAAVDRHGTAKLADTAGVSVDTLLRVSGGMGVAKLSLAALLRAVDALDAAPSAATTNPREAA